LEDNKERPINDKGVDHSFSLFTFLHFWTGQDRACHSAGLRSMLTRLVLLTKEKIKWILEKKQPPPFFCLLVGGNVRSDNPEMLLPLFSMPIVIVVVVVVGASQDTGTVFYSGGPHIHSVSAIVKHSS
jgi:hypothetical protein